MTIWLSLAGLLAALNWYAAERKLRRLIYVAKPGVMLVFLGWLWSTGQVPGLLQWFWLGALGSLAGDIFLMRSRPRFIPGLVSFLLAHIAYTIGFSTSLPRFSLWAAAPLLALALAAALYYRRLIRGPRHKNSPPRRALFAYLCAISLMGASAGLCLLRPDWPLQAGLLVTVGAFFFLISDSLLAWNRFVRPLPHAGLLVISTYHLGQFGILIGAVLQAIK